MIESRPPRRFHLIDAVVLVLATAVGLWAIRPFLPDLFESPKVLVNGRWVSRWWDPVDLLNKAVILEVMLMAWSAAWLVLQLRQPRPRLHRLTRQPGFLATFSSTAVLVVSGPITAAVLASSSMSLGIPRDDWLLFGMWSALISSQIGVAVAAGWALLAVGRRCRLSTGWLERVGQATGIVWVAMIPSNLILPFWELL
jgi:hypothetical protein